MENDFIIEKGVWSIETPTAKAAKPYTLRCDGWDS